MNEISKPSLFDNLTNSPTPNPVRSKPTPPPSTPSLFDGSIPPTLSLFEQWYSKQKFKEYNIKFVKKTIVEELARYRAMPVAEYILWQKWEEVNELYPMVKTTCFNEYTYVNGKTSTILSGLRDKLWNGDNYEDIEPELIYNNDDETIKEYASTQPQEDWTPLRVLIHTQQHSGSIGRGLSYLVRDKKTQKYLGLIAFASDFLDITCRDNYIGWTRHQRTIEQRIKHTMVCSTIVPVQPFGYNYVGGKLLALLCLSDVTQKRWKETYGSTLVGITTTSLYGKNKGGHGLSQYDRLQHWKKMGYSTGSSAYRMSNATRQIVYDWMKKNHPETYFHYNVAKRPDGGPLVRDNLNRFQQKVYRIFEVPGKDFKSNHDRGTYFSGLYTNTNEFLCNNIKEKDLIPAFDYSIESLTNLWKTKYAKKRIEALRLNNRVNKTPLFYDNLSAMTWDEAKKYYLSDVGR